MRIFAVELSSRMGSIAVVDEGGVVAERSWEESFKNRQQLFDAMASLNMDWDGVDLFAVGRGPGAFSGMRIAFSVVNSLAAPSGKPVYALNSGAALAAQCGAACTVVVGDARRNQVWAGIFKSSELQTDFSLLELNELKDFIPPRALVISPDHDRLEPLLADCRTLNDPAPVYPTASKLGELVFQRVQANIPSEPFEPLYMHPPVFIEPRFPA